MKSKFNPTQYMLISYKNSIGNSIYHESFKSNEPDISQKKLVAFSKSLVDIMNFKGFNYHYIKYENSVAIYSNETLMISYDSTIINNIKNENSLKFQLFVEWGLLIELSKKEKALIAL